MVYLVSHKYPVLYISYLVLSIVISLQEKWTHKEESDWKFNKTLQNWAVQHLLDSDKIDDSLFAKLCPYIESIQGGTLERIRELCNKAEEEGENKAKRAKHVLSLII